MGKVGKRRLRKGLKKCADRRRRMVVVLFWLRKGLKECAGQ